MAGSRQMLQGCVDVGGKKIISKGKTHGLVGGIAGFHGGNDVRGIGRVGQAGGAAAGANEWNRGIIRERKIETTDHAENTDYQRVALAWLPTYRVI